jgi:hypothetical protein
MEAFKNMPPRFIYNARQIESLPKSEIPPEFIKKEFKFTDLNQSMNQSIPSHVTRCQNQRSPQENTDEPEHQNLSKFCMHAFGRLLYPDTERHQGHQLSLDAGSNAESYDYLVPVIVYIVSVYILGYSRRLTLLYNGDQ